MKTKKLFAYVLISLFVFCPFLNFESWAALRSVPTMRLGPSCAPHPDKIIIPVCFQLGNDICCEQFMCSPDMSDCVPLGNVPQCTPITPAK